LVCCWAGTSWIYGGSRSSGGSFELEAEPRSYVRYATLAAREWFRGFFDDTYLEILKAQGGMKRTRPSRRF